MDANDSPLRTGPVLHTRALEMHYGQGEGVVRALDGVELEVTEGETLAVMGPSGCGKRRCCTCSAPWNAPRRGRSGWRTAASTG